MFKKSEISWILIDVGNSAFATTILSAIFPVYLPRLLPQEGIHFTLGSFEWTSTALSLWAYTVSFSMFLTFLISPLFGAWADEDGRRKKFLAFFTCLGALATCCLAFIDSWPWALFFFVLGNIGFSASNVFYNALLPLVTDKKNFDRLSLQGFAWGYLGGGLVLAFNLLLIMKSEWFLLSSKEVALKISFFSVGCWWLLFSLPALFWIHEQKNHPTPFVKHIRRRILNLWETLKNIPRIPSLLFFMISFAFFNDAIQTVISMASIFGKETLKLPEETLIGTLLCIQFLGLPLTLFHHYFMNRWGAKKVLVSALLFWMGIISYAFFMQTAWEFLGLGILVAFVLGVSQALPRSIFASLIPPGKQAEYFAFFALSGKMTAILGPAVFGLVRDFTGNARYSILSLSAFFLIGLIFLIPVKISRHFN